MASLQILLYFFLFCLSCSFGFVRNHQSFETTEVLPSKNYDKLYDHSGESCPSSEHWDNCYSHCQHNCSNWGRHITCPRICVSGCVCDDGFVRGHNNECIKPNQCTNLNEIFEREDLLETVEELKCPSKEHWNWCNAHCQRNCSTRDKPLRCPAICVKGCVCNAGYVRGSDGKCILSSLCPTDEKHFEAFASHPKCPEQEHWSRCTAHCQKNCTKYDKLIPCPRICVPGCVCDEDLVRGPQHQCIPSSRCPHRSEEELVPIDDFCPPNEEFSRCLAHCQRNCSNWSDPSLPCPKICVPGCICKNGMVRGPHGNCIRPRQCPPRHSLGDFTSEPECPVDERFDFCTAHCQQNCSNWNVTLECPVLGMCVAGCICDIGFVRGISGRCILPQKCFIQDNSLHSKGSAIPLLTRFRIGCPDVDACTAECIRRGRRYGVCAGPLKRVCDCY